MSYSSIDIFSSPKTDKMLEKLNSDLKKKCPNFALYLNYVTTKTMELSLKLKTGDEPIVVSQITMFNVPPDMIYINFYTEDEYQQNSFISYLIAVLVLIGDTIQFRKPSMQEPNPNEMYPAARIGLTDVTRDKISGHEMNKYIVSGGGTKRKKNGSSSASSGSSSASTDSSGSSDSSASSGSSDSSGSRGSRGSSDIYIFTIDDRTKQIAQYNIDKFFKERDVGHTCLISPKIKKEKEKKIAAAKVEARVAKVPKINRADGGKGKKKSYKKTRIRKRKSTYKRKRRTYRKSNH